MNYALIQLNGSSAETVFRKEIPAGLLGGRVQFVFGPGWEGRSRTVVFRSDAVTKDVILSPWEDTATIPSEVVAQPCHSLRVGVYGTDGEGTALPTLWVELGRVHYGADPSGDTSTDPGLPVWAQIQQQLDSLRQPEGGTVFETDETLRLENGILSVNTTSDMGRDNTLPMTSAGVYAAVGNIEAYLKTI